MIHPSDPSMWSLQIIPSNDQMIHPYDPCNAPSEWFLKLTQSVRRRDWRWDRSGFPFSLFDPGFNFNLWNLRNKLNWNAVIWTNCILAHFNSNLNMYMTCARTSVRFVMGGLTPPLVPLVSTPKFSLTPTGLVKNTKKYIADPLWFWFYHKSSTG